MPTLNGTIDVRAENAETTTPRRGGNRRKTRTTQPDATPDTPASPEGNTAEAAEAETLRLIAAYEETRDRYRRAVARAERAREEAELAEDVEGKQQEAMDRASKALAAFVLGVFGLEHNCTGNGIQEPRLVQVGGHLVIAMQPLRDGMVEECEWEVCVVRMDSLRPLAEATQAACS